MQQLQEAMQALQNGQIILLYDADGREEETDMMVASQFATPDVIRTFRKDAGGLLCTTVAKAHHEHLDLPFLTDLVQGMRAQHPVLAHLIPDDIKYDANKSSFGLTINHRDTFTGIPDSDRSLTITKLAQFLQNPAADVPQAQVAFGKQFRAPGHVILLNSQELADRQGHTELSTTLLAMAGLTPSATICEMLDDNGNARTQAEAREYAAAHDMVFLTGDEVIQAWKSDRIAA